MTAAKNLTTRPQQHPRCLNNEKVSRQMINEINVEWEKSVQADQIGRTYPPLFTLNLSKEEEIMDDLREISVMEYVVQVIMIIVCIAVVIIVMSFCCMKCRHTRTIFKYCLPFLPISHIIHTSRHTDLFVEVTNITKGNGIWAHFVSTRYFPSQIQLSRPIQKDDVQIETFCCIFK